MTLQPNQIEQLKRMIKCCVAKVYHYDIDLIERGGMEQTISFRFGLYLYSYIETHEEVCWLRKFTVDSEYNKNGDEPKSTPRQGKGARPDIIIHRRRENCDNVLVIEIKGWWSNNPREKDPTKLEDFTCQDGEYRYGLGAFLIFGKTIEKCVPEYYIGGTKVDV